MLQFIARRFIIMIPTVILISVVSFIIIELPPGDFLTRYVQHLEMTDTLVNEGMIESLRERYHLDRPWHFRYFRWITGFARLDFGFSLYWREPVLSLIGERMLLTLAVTLASTLFTWIVALPIGVYSAVKQYSAGDYVFTVIGFLGLAIPNFMLALVLMFVGFRFFGISIGGLFSQEFVFAPWSLGKVWDLVKHLWIPMIVVGTAGTASTIRIMRANLLDELRKQYVVTARAKGLPEGRVVFKYPVRVALNPFISTVGWLLPELLSGATITAVVLGLPTAGPMFLEALREQDMFLAGSFVMFVAMLTVIGTLISDVLLAMIDPRIRYG